MELKEIRAHWDALAQKHGLDLKSTTKTPTIKQLEINALARAISKFASVSKTNSVLEIGCGNGHNLFGLARIFPTFKFHGIDYSDDMIVAACKIKNELPDSQLDFSTGDVLNLTATASFQNNFDVVFIDGMHQVEYVINDFNNSVKHLNKNGKIVLDDIIPLNLDEQKKIPTKHYYDDGVLKTSVPWTGDVWKILYHILLNYREFVTFNYFYNINSRGVAVLEIKETFHIEITDIEAINNYSYIDDFENYMSFFR